MPLSCTAVDSGDQTQTVYTFCREFSQPQVVPVKGMDNMTVLVGIPKPADISARGKTIRRGVMVWPVGSSLLKDELYSALKLERPTAESGDPLPPLWCDFPEYGEDYFKGLCSEQRMRKKNKRGYISHEWVKVHERNEPLDCRNYARAAAAIKGMDRWTPDDWRALRQLAGLDGRAGKATDKNTQHGVTFRKSDFWNK